VTSSTYLELKKMNAVKCVAQFKLQTVGVDTFCVSNFDYIWGCNSGGLKYSSGLCHPSYTLMVCVMFELLQHMFTAYGCAEVLFELGSESQPLL
jgi:hypothetical protein